MASTEKKSRNVKQAIEVTCIDSREPVTTLLEHFKSNITPAYYEYCKILGQRETRSTLGYRHHLLPGHPVNVFPDDWDGILPTNYFEPFPYRSTFPKIITPLLNENQSDPVTELMERKNDWLSMLNYRLKGLHETGAHLRVKKLNSEVMSCPNNVLQAAIQAENDPEPYFSSAHNWYYTGHGNMHLVTLDGDEYMLHSELNHLYLSKFTLDQLSIDPEPVFSYDCGVGDNILETIFNDNNLIVALRTKTRVILLKIDADKSNEFTIARVKEVTASIPYTSIAFDPIHKDILYVTNLNNKLSIINMEKMKCRTVKLTESETLIDNWSSVFGIDRNMYGHITSDNIHLYDKRDNSIVNTWSEPANVSDELCNKFSVARMCDTKPFLYIGSTHHLFLADLRYLSNGKINFLRRWTHQMKCVPTYLTMCNFEYNKDLVYLTSQWYEDMCIVSNDSENIEKGVTGNSITMPFRPPSVEHTLNEARMKMLCLNIHHPIENRLYTATTGTTVLEKDEKVYVFNQNSLGDKFCHILYQEHIEMWDDDGPERLDKWYRSIKPLAQAIEISAVEDISQVWRDLKRVPADMTFGCRKLWPWVSLKYSEQEVVDTFENDLDIGLLEAWGDKTAQMAASENCAVHLHFSDSE